MFNNRHLASSLPTTFLPVHLAQAVVTFALGSLAWLIPTTLILNLVACNNIKDTAQDSAPADDTSIETGCSPIDWYRDADGDTFGSPNESTYECEQPTGYVHDNTDCDDNTNTINPLATEVCDDKDNDCDGLTDDADTVADPTTWYKDSDGDGYGDPDWSDVRTACTEPDAAYHFAANDLDCDDMNADINPAGTEVCDNFGADEDCDGFANSADLEGATGSSRKYPDVDNDNYGDALSVGIMACANDTSYTAYVTDNTDCNDTDSEINPFTLELCDEADVDEDCNGLSNNADSDADGKDTYYTDSDGDGYGSSSDLGTLSCANGAPANSITNNQDCDDADGSISPAGIETCANSGDEDCDELFNSADPSVIGTTDYYTDGDGDGHGADVSASQYCASDVPSGYSTDNTDCDDANPFSINCSAGGVDTGTVSDTDSADSGDTDSGDSADTGVDDSGTLDTAILDTGDVDTGDSQPVDSEDTGTPADSGDFDSATDTALPIETDTDTGMDSAGTDTAIPVDSGDTAPTDTGTTEDTATIPDAGISLGAYVNADLYTDASSLDGITSVNDLSAFETLAGQPLAIVNVYTALTWDGTPYDFPVDQIQEIISYGAIPMLTIEPRDWDSSSSYYTDSYNDNIVNGDLDAVWDAWFADINNYFPDDLIIIRYGQEMNGDWYSYGNDPSGFIGSYQYFVDYAVASGVDNVLFSICYNYSTAGYAFSDFWPGDSYVDLAGIDMYDNPDWNGSRMSFVDLYTDFDTFISDEHSGSWTYIGEMSSIEDSTDVTVKADFIEYAYWAMPYYPSILFVNWFDEDQTADGGYDWRIDSSVESLAAFQTAITDPYYLSSTEYIEYLYSAY